MAAVRRTRPQASAHDRRRLPRGRQARARPGVRPAVAQRRHGRADSYRGRLVEEGKLSARTINKRLVVLHDIFRRAMRVYGLRSNPAALVDREPLRRSGEFSVLDRSRWRRLLARRRTTSTQQSSGWPRSRGSAWGELRALRWQDIDFGMRLVHVRRNFTHGAEGSPKSGRVWSVPLIDQAAKALDSLSRREWFTADKDLVFVDEPGGHVDDWRLRIPGPTDRYVCRALSGDG